jgi:hypothetical protein
MKRAALTSLLAAVALAPNAALADVDEWTAIEEFHPSPEHFGLELRVGSYMPLNLGADWETAFGSDLGPMLGIELDYYPTRIPYLGLVGGGVGLGWSEWSGTAPAIPPSLQGEDEAFMTLPIYVVLTLRFDTLARELGFPLVITPKVGLDVVYWKTGTETNQHDGWSIGPRFAGKVSLELDFLEPRAARQLDEEWGVNHSELFFEPWYSMAGDLISSELPVSGWGWTVGLGLTF